MAKAQGVRTKPLTYEEISRGVTLSPADQAALEEHEREESRRAAAEELADLDADEGGSLIAAIEELRSTEGTNFIIVRVSQPNPGYCGQIPSTEMSVERIKDEFGPGRYKVRPRGPKGFVPGGSTVNIAGHPDAHKRGGGAVDSTPAGEFMRMMQLQEEKSSARLLQWGAIAAPIIAAMLGNKGTDVAALITAMKPAPQPSMPEMLAALKELTPKEKESGSFDTFLKAAEFVQNMGGKNSGDTNWLDLLKEGMALAKPALERVATGMLTPPVMPMQLRVPHPPGAVPPAPSLSAPASSVAPAAAESFAPVATTGSADINALKIANVLPWLQQTLAVLIQHASRAKDPGLYAALVLDNLPPDLTGAEVAQMAKREDWWAMLKQVSSGVSPYEGWFKQFAEELIAEVEESSGHGLQPPGYTGETDTGDES